MSAAQPIHRTTGERGPVFEFATMAALWCAVRPDLRAWRWEAVKATPCRHCGQPGGFVRTRYFAEGHTSNVWECQTRGCQAHNLIWHTDNPPTVIPSPLSVS